MTLDNDGHIIGLDKEWQYKMDSNNIVGAPSTPQMKLAYSQH